MCGITAVYNMENAPYNILKMIVAQDKRGKDATGVAYIENGELKIIKKAIEPSKFKEEFETVLQGVNSKICIGHNRQASTNVQNKDKDHEAHPFVSEDGEFALVHNGTFVGYSYIGYLLDVLGHNRISGTDTEIFVHLLEEFLKRFPREEAVKRFYPLTEGNILILFKDGEIYGLPGYSFYVLKTGKTILVASEPSTFKALIESIDDEAELYDPGTQGCLLKISNNKVELLGKWDKEIWKRGSWIYEREVVCDFCGVKKPCEKIIINGKEYDRCYDCFRSNKTVPRNTYTYTPQRNYYTFYGEYEPIAFRSETVKTKSSEKVWGVCALCSKLVPSDDLLLCSRCNRLYCFKHFEDHDCRDKEKEVLKVAFIDD